MIQVTNKAIVYYERVYPNINNPIHFLDRITPVYLNYCNKLPPLEQELLYYLSHAKDKLSCSDLNQFTRESTSILAVYLKSMEVKGIIKKTIINNQYLYFIDDIVFKKWSTFRWSYGK